MEVEADPNLLVVSLDHCISTVSDEARQQGKTNCIYTAALANGSNVHDTTVLQLPAPIQCISDPNQTLPRFQQQHLTQLQPIQYSAVQVGYDGLGLHHHEHHHEQHHRQEGEGGGEEQGLYQPFPHVHPLQHNLHNLLPPLSPPPPPQSLCRPPPPPPEEPTYPLDSFEYYKEIEHFLSVHEYPPTSSENYRKHLKKRAQNYIVIDGILHHGRRKPPKKVVMKKEEQKEMLEKLHVVEETGVHLGVKKMFSIVQEKHFWRGMYVDVANYVKQCNKCSDLVDVARQLKAKEGKLEDNRDSEDIDDPPATSNRNIGVQTSSQVWQEVEVKLNGPYKMTNSKNEYILSITDTVSKFTCACGVPKNGLSSRLAEFTMKMFCVLGFSRVRVVCDQPLFEAFLSEFMWRLGDLGVPSLFRTDSSSSSWLHTLFTSLVEAHPSTWDKEMDKFLFRFNVGSLKDFVRPTPLCGSPFSVFYNRSPFPQSDSENKEIVNWLENSSSKKFLKTTQKWPSCSEDSPSKKSLKVLQQEDCKGPRTKKHSFPYTKKKKGSNRLPQSLESQVEGIGFKPPGTCVESTVSAVKAYLAETKEERRKRGKYQKYTVELQEHMAAYAMKNGNQKAAQYFSRTLGTHVSDSTIRNLVKSHMVFQPGLKEEIARFAVDYGVERASNYFSERLNRNVPHNLVRKFKSMYTDKLPEVGGIHEQSPLRNDKEMFGKENEGDLMNVFNSKTREEIGLYACNHSVVEAIRHFSENLGISVNEDCVRRFHKEYLEKQNSVQATETITELHPMGHALSTTISYTPLVQQHLSVQNLYQTNVCFQTTQTGSVIIPQTNAFAYPSAEGFEAAQQIYPQVTAEQDQCHVLHHGQIPSSCIFTHENLPPHLPHPNLYELRPAPHVQKEREHEENKGRIEGVTGTQSRYTQEMETLRPEETFTEGVANKRKDPDKTERDPRSKKSKLKKKKIKKEPCSRKRGSYTTYSPELRAEIGRYTAENGSLKASNYFTLLLGHDVPESTARGLKEKYLFKVKHCDVTSLGYSQRGRPLRLGKYDEVVQECLKELVRSGEKVSSFLAITTAKEILNKYDPSLLQENGGTIVLNNTWAKSFLKRIGVRNNS